MIVKCSVPVVTRATPHFCNYRDALASCVKCRKVFCTKHRNKHPESKPTAGAMVLGAGGVFSNVR